jgi:hypothetical protein
MSTLEGGYNNNSNGEVPVYLREVARQNPRLTSETIVQYYDRLTKIKGR